MIINKKITILSLAIIAIFSLALNARAEAGNDNGKSDDGREMTEEGIQTMRNGETGTSTDEDVKTMRNDDSATSTEKNKSDDDSEDSDEMMKDGSANSMGEEHRSEMADIMEKLGKLADRGGSVSDEVRDIIKEQKDTEDKVVQAMNEVEKRDGLRTFFFGTDYKNLGELRSTMMTTENHIERLQKASLRTTDATVKAGLEAEIEAHKNTASSTEVFIRDNEGKFSLFGWFVRIFQN